MSNGAANAAGGNPSGCAFKKVQINKSGRKARRQGIPSHCRVFPKGFPVPVGVGKSFFVGEITSVSANLVNLAHGSIFVHRLVFLKGGYMSKESRRVHLILENLNKLKNEFERLRQENEDLTLRVGGLESRLGDTMQRYEKLEEEHQRLKLAKALVSTGGDKAQMKMRVNEMVREIDKCIALLNR